MLPRLTLPLRAVFAATLLCSPLAQADAPESGYARLLIQPRVGTSASEFHQVLRRQRITPERTIRGIGVAVTRVPEHAADSIRAALANNPHIQFVEVDRALELNGTSANDTYYPHAWHLATVEAPLAWDYGFGDGITVAVLDTGVNDVHADLSGKVLSGWNSANNSGDTSDINGHGTSVAGVIGAVSNNGTGVASVAWNAMLLPVRVSNSTDGVAYISDIAEGLVWAADQGADVSNISYNVTGSTTLNSAAKYMHDKGGVVVVAAGNSGSEYKYADSPYVISVSATNSADSRTSWSSYGEYVDVSSPGAGIYTTTKDGGYGKVSGTSFASPLTAGIVALMKAANSTLSPLELEQALESSAVDLGAAGYDIHYGHGRVDAAAAVQAALNTTLSDTIDAINDTTSDATPPSVTITSPAGGAGVYDTLAVDVDAADDTAVDRVVFLVNGTVIGTDTSAPFGFSWDTTSVDDGSVTLTARAWDVAGNPSAHKIQVDVGNTGSLSDTTPPSVTFITPGHGASVSGTVAMGVDAVDDIAMDRVVFVVNGTVVGTDTSAPFDFSWDSTSVADGIVTLNARAWDAAGNHSAHKIRVEVSNNNGGGHPWK